MAFGPQKEPAVTGEHNKTIHVHVAVAIRLYGRLSNAS